MTIITLALFAMTFALAVTCYIIGADNERRRQQVAWLAGELRDAREAHDERDARCRELERQNLDLAARVLVHEGHGASFPVPGTFEVIHPTPRPDGRGRISEPGECEELFNGQAWRIQ